MKVSGFTFIHNALNAGYPVFEAIAAIAPYVDEVVVVDMQSDDGTSEALEKLHGMDNRIRIVEGVWWPGKAGRCLSYNHSLNRRCDNDLIWHFEADEVFEPLLAQDIFECIQPRPNCNKRNIAVWRLQVEQNFQRVRWYPEPVHRVFERGKVAKSGHTTTYDGELYVIPPSSGFLWDVTNCFRDQWVARTVQQAELWGNEPSKLRVPLHVTHGHDLSSDYPVDRFLEEPQWTWDRSPLNLPGALRLHLGHTTYTPNWDYIQERLYSWPQM